MEKTVTFVKCTWLSRTSARSETYGTMDPSQESIVSVIDQCMVAAIAAKGEDETLKVLVEVGTPREMEVNVDGGALFDALNGGQLYCEFTRERLKDREKVIIERESAKAVVGGDLLTKEICGAFHSLENV